MFIEFNSGIIKTKEEKVIVNNINFSIDKNKSLALVGESGSGKTTIALALLKLLSSNLIEINNNYIFNNLDLTNTKHINNLLGNEIVYIPQSGLDYLNPTRTIKNQLYDSLKKNNVKKKDLLEEAKNKLRLAGFLNENEVLDKYPFELSGGMATKVLLAISLCSNPSLVILDEAINGLDNESKNEFVNKIKSLFKNASLIFITHDIDVAKLCDDVLIIKDGSLVEYGSSDSVLNNPKEEYTKLLISSLPKNGMNNYKVNKL